MKRLFVALLLPLQLWAANASAQGSAALDLFPSESVDTARLGVNAFVNDPRFGTIRQQFLEVKKTLRLRYVRVLFVWDDRVQPTPASTPNFSFYDAIVRGLPRNVEAFAVVTGLPSWMSDSANWIDNNPRKTFVELFLRKLAARYKKRRRLKGFQVWNEPNMASNPDNTTLGVADSPQNYVELMRFARGAMRAVVPRRRLISGATTAIAQNYPETLEYNEALRAHGMADLIDIWAIHYYGTHYENLLRPHNVIDFLNGLTVPVWITEIGERGVNDQREYLEQTLPLLMRLAPRIQRAYIYQFTEDSPADDTYGLRNLTPGRELSDLYIWLRDR